MTSLDIAYQRLCNQHIAEATFEKPSDVVQWLGAVQAQDYLGSLWAIGLRMRNAIQADIEQAIADKTIVRTWPMRGTLHFVAPADVRWMLELLTPRIIAGSQRRFQQFGLDDAIFARSKELLTSALQGGKQLTRNAMYQVLEAGGIAAANQRGLHILGRLAQDGIICFGARKGKQPTFALLDEWVPAAKTLERDEALAELARRYFTSHGPATPQDFGWWSGLTAADARAGLEMVRSEFIQEVIDGRAFWLSASVPTPKVASPAAYLLPAYDEYTVAYKDRSALLDPRHAQQAGSSILGPTIAVDGQIVGTWKRTLKKETVIITPSLFTPLSKAKYQALAEAAHRYGAFLDMTVTL